MPEIDGERCLNCGAPGPLAFCASCGQRHVPADRLDLRHVWLEYVEQGLRELKPVHTLGTLFRRPGVLTLGYVEGARKQQANPLVLFLFLVALNLTLVQQQDLAELTRSSLTGLPKDQIESTLSLLQPAFAVLTTVLTYGAPLIAIPLGALSYRLLLGRDLLTASVFVLHTSIATYCVGLVLQLPSVVVAPRHYFLASGAATALTTAFALIYETLAARTVYRHGWGRTIASVLGAWVVTTAAMVVAWTVIVLLVSAVAFVLGVAVALTD